MYALPDTSWSKSVVTWNTVLTAGGLLDSVGPIVAGGWYEVNVTAHGAVAVRMPPDASSADYSLHGAPQRLRVGVGH